MLICEFGEERRNFVPISEIPDVMKKAVLAIEDDRFYEHGGVDFVGVMRAGLANLRGGLSQGASTITMQVARNFFLSSEKTYTRKIYEMLLAYKIEANLSKDQILEAYLNLVPYRGELVGLSAMSQTLYGKVPSGLDARESAVAVALVRSPNASAQQVARRACGILREMRQPRECDGLDGFTALVLAKSTRAGADSMHARRDAKLACQRLQRRAGRAFPDDDQVLVDAPIRQQR
ncbi:UNVERIFIED_CONTAM: transglycosylase domain-containing protein, partial [Microbacterium sp. SLM126]